MSFLWLMFVNLLVLFSPGLCQNVTTICNFCNSRVPAKHCDLPTPGNKTCTGPDSGCHAWRFQTSAAAKSNFTLHSCHCKQEVDCLLNEYKLTLDSNSCVRFDTPPGRYQRFLEKCDASRGPSGASTNCAKARLLLSDDENDEGGHEASGRLMLNYPRGFGPRRGLGKIYKIKFCSCTGNFCNTKQFWDQRFSEDDEKWFAEGVRRSGGSKSSLFIGKTWFSPVISFSIIPFPLSILKLLTTTPNSKA